jgi:predicted DNA-binding transcriptional regulator
VRALEKALGCPRRTARFILNFALREGLVRREGSRMAGYTYYLVATDPEGEASTTPAE